MLDSYTGSIKLRNELIKSKELTLVFYYAPWCQRSMDALKEFEMAAKEHLKQVRR